MSSPDPDRPRIVCICGSTRHRSAILDAVREETLAGRIVLAPGVFSQADGEVLAPEVVDRLTALHEDKIRMADEVVVVDVDGVGEATAREVALARSLGKPVRYRAGRPTPIEPVAARRESPPELAPILRAHGAPDPRRG